MYVELMALTSFFNFIKNSNFFLIYAKFKQLGDILSSRIANFKVQNQFKNSWYFEIPLAIVP